MTIVQFPDNSRVRPVGQVCAEFCARWRGSDVGEGARLLQCVLPEHVPGGLRLVIARALREIDLPAFSSAEDFRSAVKRFATCTGDLADISDVRRARRNSRMTLERLSRETSLPTDVVLQLEWGDFREWHDAEWTRRVCYAYARAAAIDPERVVAIVESERAQQFGVHGEPSPRQPATGRRWGAVAAAALLAVGFLSGIFVADRVDVPRLRQPTNSSIPVSQAPVDRTTERGTPEAGAPRRPARTDGSTPSPIVQSSSSSPKDPGKGRDGRLSQRRQLRPVRLTGSDGFSPAFSSVGGAVFYHQNEGTGSALMKAVGDGSTGELRVVSVVQDGARNYHAKPSPDGSSIAFDSDRDGERGVYIASADGSGVRRVSGPGFAAVPSWSPDGSRLAFVRGEASTGNRVWNLWLLDLASNASVRLTSYRYGQPWGASWFPDGRRLAYSHEDRLNVLDLETSARRTFRSPVRGRLLRTPAVSPDGRHIVFQVYRDGAWLLDLRDGSTRRILADPTAEEFAWDATGRRLAFHSRRSGAWSVWIMSGR